jgi:hypothetical protein
MEIPQQKIKKEMVYNFIIMPDNRIKLIWDTLIGFIIFISLLLMAFTYIKQL